MSLAAFLDAALALQVREAVRLGLPLLDALDRVRHMSRSGGGGRPRVPVPAAANERSMAQLQAMMRGVSRRG